MSKFVILLNGDLTITNRLKSQIEGARVIGVDGGIRYSQALGVEPECWIGDFDSSDDELNRKWQSVPRLQYPVEKNETDGELALQYALAQQAKEIILVGGLGGETDHAFCHVSQLVWLARQKVPCFATSGLEEAWPLVVGRFQWDLPADATMSIIGLTDFKDLCLTGLKWPLKCVDVEFGSSLTMSNKVSGPVSGSLDGGYGIALVKDIV